MQAPNTRPGHAAKTEDSSKCRRQDTDTEHGTGATSGPPAPVALSAMVYPHVVGGPARSWPIVTALVLGCAGQADDPGSPESGSSETGDPVGFEVIELSPPANRTGSVDGPIRIRFSTPVDRDAVADNIGVFGYWTGPATLEITYEDEDHVVVLRTDELSAGERVSVTIASSIEAADGTPYRPEGYVHQYWASSEPASMTLELVEAFSVSSDSKDLVRPYGGLASDLDNDGWLDLSIVNEDSEDVRVFLNPADGTGSFADPSPPRYGAGEHASPSEPGDFDGDGNIDMVVGNIVDGTLSILLGNGDGSFAPQQQVMVHQRPRGLAVFDVDGDGDTDIINTNVQGDDLSLLLNDGTGVFGEPSFFESGAAGERALGAGDMDNDGILDLVIGTRDSGNLVIMLGDGAGAFETSTIAHIEDEPWTLMLGDVDGDGNVDVVTANGEGANAGVTRGDGIGGLHEQVRYPVDPGVFSVDIGDLDGDGDLDMITSSLFGRWGLLRNDGTGTYELESVLDAPEGASCALLMDFDNDGDLDMTLVDELVDILYIVRNE